MVESLLLTETVAFEFDDSILGDLGFSNVDLTAFGGENDQFSGKYVVDVRMNEITVLEDQDVYFYSGDDDSNLCFTSTFVRKLPFSGRVKKDLASKVIHVTDVGECLDVESLDTTVSIDFDSEKQLLNIVMPQKFIVNIDSSWVSPEDRDPGISGVILDYSMLLTHVRDSVYKDNSTSFRSNGVVGANLGMLRIRANYQYDSEAKNKSKLEWTQRYGFMDVGAINSKLFVGELYSRSNVFNSVRFKGVSLYSDPSMMPAYLKGYAPQVTGTVTSNAIVSVKQNGHVIRTMQVPVGPFVISDLPSYLNGTVDVEIEESDGSIRSYQVDVAQVPFLTRKGTIRYSANIGRLNPLHAGGIKTGFVSADATYGLTNAISIYGGTLFSSNGKYISWNAGLGSNLGILGALSFDITQSENKANTARTLKGHSYRFNYAKKFSSNTTLSLVGYRFSSRNFTNINNYIDMSSGRMSSILEKNRLSISLSQYIPKIRTNISISATKGTYWNSKTVSNYNISLSKHIDSGLFKSAHVQFSWMRNTQAYSKAENQFMFMMSIPLSDNHQRMAQYNARYNKRDHNVSQQATYRDQAFGGNVSIGGGMFHKRDFSGSVDYNLNASYDREIAFGNLTATADYTPDRQQFASSYDGSITVTKHGIATHQRVYENNSRLILDVGAPGVLVDREARSNLFGLSGMSNIPGYYQTTYRVDNDNLPENLEIQDGIVDLTVTDGAIAYRSLGAISGEKAIVTIVLPDGSHPPFGAVVYRENGQDNEVAIVADKGLTYLTGINKKSKFIVKWNSVKSCELKIPTLDIDALQELTCYMD